MVVVETAWVVVLGVIFLGEGVFLPALPMIPDVSCFLFFAGLSKWHIPRLEDEGGSLMSREFLKGC